ncbi:MULTISPECIES: hypothetical protein [Paenibacillus]|uniref:hypothetical protein n=1 Tax=Paenibacillus sp. TaxID=58172 RepID=UPI00211AE5A6|nr:MULTISPECIES: hypothetical protein [Paenibacillus]
MKDQRYVSQGNIISSAGLTSGIDATLHVISQQLGEAAAKKVASEINTYILNQAYQWKKDKAGVLLYPGADELDLSAALPMPLLERRLH